MPYFLPVTGKTTFLGEEMWRGRGPGVRLTMDISQEMIDSKTKGNAMRMTFTLEVKAEIESYDTKKRQVILRLMNETAKRINTQVTMLSDNVSPKIKLTATNGNGVQQDVDLFKGEK